MLVTFEVQLMVWVFVDVLLRNSQSGQFTRICIMKIETHIRRINISFVGTVEPILGVTWPRQVPDPERVISTSRHNQRALWPFFLAHVPVLVFDINPFRFDNSQAAHSTRMPAKYVGATACGEVPNSDGPIG
jgi:hypothetical protein